MSCFSASVSLTATHSCSVYFFFFNDTATTEIYTLSLHVFFFNDTATTEIYTLSLHDALPISSRAAPRGAPCRASCLEPEARLRPTHEGAPHQTVPADDDHAHQRDAPREQWEVGVGGGVADQTSQALGHLQPAGDLHVFRDDRAVPRTPGGRHPPGHQRGKRGRQVQRSEERRVGKEGRSRWSPYH